MHRTRILQELRHSQDKYLWTSSRRLRENGGGPRGDESAPDEYFQASKVSITVGRTSTATYTLSSHHFPVQFLYAICARFLLSPVLPITVFAFVSPVTEDGHNFS
jgi:hypothetical protein